MPEKTCFSRKKIMSRLKKHSPPPSTKLNGWSLIASKRYGIYLYTYFYFALCSRLHCTHLIVFEVPEQFLEVCPICFPKQPFYSHGTRRVKESPML